MQCPSATGCAGLEDGWDVWGLELEEAVGAVEVEDDGELGALEVFDAGAAPWPQAERSRRTPATPVVIAPTRVILLRTMVNRLPCAG
ncbi:hypothetical protein [Amycolatopsis sp. NPDC059021]|uniref:hypothetical protein n=1 Tax=Amycolatopsis sp. NPDC059021 TaxID=3346704 RepID=UPI0036735F56